MPLRKAIAALQHPVVLISFAFRWPDEVRGFLSRDTTCPRVDCSWVLIDSGVGGSIRADLDPLVLDAGTHEGSCREAIGGPNGCNMAD